MVGCWRGGGADAAGGFLGEGEAWEEGFEEGGHFGGFWGVVVGWLVGRRREGWADCLVKRMWEDWAREVSGG